MRKRWYVFIAIALVIFQIAVTQPFAYAAKELCDKNRYLVKSGENPIFCISDQKQAQEISKKLAKIAEDTSFNSDYFIVDPQRKTLDISYRILDNNNSDLVMIGGKWKDIVSLTGVDTDFNNLKIIKNPVKITKMASTGFFSNAMIFIQSNITCFIVPTMLMLFGIFIIWSRQDDFIIKQRLWWTIGLAVLLVLASCEGFQFSQTDFASYVVFILPVCLGLLGGFYSSLQSIGTAKIQKALEYIDKWDSADLQKHRQTVISTKIIQKVNDSKANKNCINEETKTEEDVEIEIVRAAIETKDEGTGMVEINSDLDFALRTISNFWEKMYIVLNSDLADRATLQDAFRELYEDKYFKVCRAFLGYLESKKSSPSTVGKMEEHLNKLKAKLMP
jgi:hypothetical protein